jgi:ATP-dependent HslUV protease ATP-binding subunit HslU
VLERLLEEVSFEGPDLSSKTVSINAQYVNKHLQALVKDEDLSRYIL